MIQQSVVCLMLLAFQAIPTYADNILTIRPIEDFQPLINPGKGWISYGDPSKKTIEELSLTSLGYARFDWNQIQPDGAGHFDWSKIDAFINAWAAKGKKAAFGVMAGNTQSGGDGYVTPQWVFDAGVPERVFTIDGKSDAMIGSPGVKREPRDYDNPIFMKFIEQLIQAMAVRYDGDPRIEFIDIRSFGNWGESFDKAHLLLHLKYFKKTRLAQSSQNVLWSEWIASHGVAVRRDGIGGSHGEELRPALGLAPAIMEFWGSVPYLDKKGWWNDGRLISDSIEVGAPTYIQFPSGPSEILAKYNKLIERVTNRIGFHFFLKEASYRDSVSESMPFSMKLIWQNDGVSKIFAPCTTAVALIKNSGEIVRVSAVSGSAPGNWAPGQLITEAGAADFSGVQPGKYRIAIGLLSGEKEKIPSYRIAIVLPKLGNWYVLGNVEVTR
ncbi:DUF4832 domain-containing protein [Paraburkholderia fungorum]|uniref:DUF4832 domain-containing protein n=1 Tax=Paraburkholderia fungorum TaxID=134537 RepID=UPI001C1F0FEF|nr:DUF4832 domain-containing protein [Paraburkholderia fungorum]MBU7439621.1 DUF4832 domain-containing protein [Paraburkholderia fungorum]